MLKNISSISFYVLFFIELINFNEKVVFNVTLNITFLLKLIYLMKIEDERG
jgi:hypothetical protein